MALQDEFPPVVGGQTLYSGVYPVDFIFETILRAGIDWFRTNTDAPNRVFGHLLRPMLSKYGQAKIDEIAAFINEKEIKIVQHYSLIDQHLPTISIQLSNASEDVAKAFLEDFSGEVESASLVGSHGGEIPIQDNLIIGIHAPISPDLAKYLYYLVIHILMVFKEDLIEKGMLLSTFNATDVTLLNQYLPENIYSRFVTFSVVTYARFHRGEIPFVDDFELNMAAEGRIDSFDKGDEVDETNTDTAIITGDPDC